MRYLMILVALVIMMVGCGEAEFDRTVYLDNPEREVSYVLGDSCGDTKIYKDYIKLIEIGFCISDYENGEDFKECYLTAKSIDSGHLVCVDEDIISL